MGDTTAPLVKVFIALCIVSLGTNVILGYQWQSERQQLRTMIAGTKNELQLRNVENSQLSEENQDFQTDIARKEQELAKKIAELATKQSALNDLSKQLADKKSELDTKIRDLADAKKQVDSQKSQLDANASELSKLRDRPPLFSFQVKSTSIVDVEAKKASVQQIVTDAYELFDQIYPRYLLNSVTITFVDAFSNPNAAGETVISNSKDGLSIEIRIKDFNKNSFNDINTILHEVAHALRGVATVEPTAWEEGSAVAITDVVMRKLGDADRIPKFSSYYIQLTDTQYEAKQANLSIPRDANAFYSSTKVVDFYQVLGKAWYKLYEQDIDFFKKFNEKLYDRKARGEVINEAMVLDIVRQVLPEASLTGAAWNLK